MFFFQTKVQFLKRIPRIRKTFQPASIIRIARFCNDSSLSDCDAVRLWCQTSNNTCNVRPTTLAHNHQLSDIIVRFRLGLILITMVFPRSRPRHEKVVSRLPLPLNFWLWAQRAHARFACRVQCYHLANGIVLFQFQRRQKLHDLWKCSYLFRRNMVAVNVDNASNVVSILIKCNGIKYKRLTPAKCFNLCLNNEWRECLACKFVFISSVTLLTVQKWSKRHFIIFTGETKACILSNCHFHYFAANNLRS